MKPSKLAVYVMAGALAVLSVLGAITGAVSGAAGAVSAAAALRSL